MTVSITSTGYGDYFIYTVIGRIVGILCGFLGAYIVSLYITVCAGVLELSNRQQDSHYVLNQQRLHDIRVYQLKQIAATLIQIRFRIHLRRRGIVVKWPILEHFNYTRKFLRLL
jgi:hypothetical protein